MTLLAQAQLSERSNEFFRYMRWEATEGRGTPLQIFEQLAWVAGAILLLLGLLYVCGLLQSRRAEPVARQPYRLFRRTMAASGLGLVDRMLLRMIVRANALPHPTILLLSPQLLEECGRVWAGRVRLPPVRSAAWQRLSEIARNLYGQPLAPL